MTEVPWAGEIEPTYEGMHGKVWRVAKPDIEGDPRSGLETGDLWLVFSPMAHPFWSWHLIMCVALREQEGVPPAKKQYPEAEYELIVWALSPDLPVPPPTEWPLGKGEGILMSPPDAIVQFDGPTQEQAGEIVELAARACTSGLLVPDSDYAQRWADMIKKTAQHYAEGVH